MKHGRTLPVIQPGTGSGLSRRVALQTLAVGLGASVAVPGLAEASDHPVHKHVARMTGQAPPADGADFQPTTLDAHQFTTVVALAELIVPGAASSGTPEFIDKLLGVESPETRRRFVTALGAMDGAALARHRQPFKALAPAEQESLLTAASTGEPSRQAVYWKKGDAIPVPVPPPAPATLRDHFDHLKGWIAGIYFASEPGLKELGYTGTMFHESFPGCEHGGQHD